MYDGSSLETISGDYTDIIEDYSSQQMYCSDRKLSQFVLKFDMIGFSS